LAAVRQAARIASIGGTTGRRAAAGPSIAAVEQRTPSGRRSPDRPLASAARCWVNDVHSRLNPTPVLRIERPASRAALARLVRRAAARGESLSTSGGRHAMGGQAFATDAALIDTSALDRVLALDRERGTVEVEAGITWPALVAALGAIQGRGAGTWGIRQKQTGADRLSLGGALAANIHGRGLRSPPFVADVESFELIGPDGEPLCCSRAQNTWHFRRAVGGYGLFGPVSRLTLRLAPRRQLVRRVALAEAEHAVAALEAAAVAGAEFGDCQLAIDERSGDFLRTCVLSTYHPVPRAQALHEPRQALTEQGWRRLIDLAHRDKARAFRDYAAHYLGTSGQIYWSDEHQLGTHVDGYHAALDRTARTAGSEMITELYVPRQRVPPFLEALRAELRARRAEVIYSTLRLIEAEHETILAWARERWACLVLNLHTRHDRQALARTADTFRALIDHALEQGGTYYLTYHRWARRAQAERGHPNMRSFLEEKLAWDPGERFTSDWYRHHRALLWR
jgi:FAD/FMN-containing dehydrogenase